MRYIRICRIAGGALVFIIGVVLSFAGAQLWARGSAAAPDIIASDLVVRGSAYALIIMAVLLIVSGIATLRRVPWGSSVAAVAVIILVTAAFAGNYLLFGDIRILHTGTNVIGAVIILALLRAGSSHSNTGSSHAATRRT